jgi:hypothetical protein
MQPAMVESEPPRTPEELSEYLGIPLRTLTQWRWITKNTGVQRGPRYVRMGHHVRYPRRDTQEWIDAGCDTPEQARRIS